LLTHTIISVIIAIMRKKNITLKIKDSDLKVRKRFPAPTRVQPSKKQYNRKVKHKGENND